MVFHLFRGDCWLGELYQGFSEQRLEKDLEACAHVLLGAGREGKGIPQRGEGASSTI